MNTLIANPEGVKYLMESEFLEQLEIALTELDPVISIDDFISFIFTNLKIFKD